MKWKQGNKILIKAGTGKGKTYFVKNELIKQADDWDQKILFLSNRKALREQTSLEIKEADKQDIIQVMTYQKFERQIFNGTVDISGFKYIVCDEAHYFFSDATFNRMTNLGLEYVKNHTDDKIVILMSATPSRIKAYFQVPDELTYELKNEYSYISEIFTYTDQETLINLLNSLPENEKVIYFSSAEKALKVSQEVRGSAFICSKNNPWRNFSNQKELENIQIYSKFECRALCTTKILDNGVNIIDSNLKHIVVDMLDIDTVIQCIGRKRVQSSEDTITLYIADKSYASLQTRHYSISKALEQAICLRDQGEKAFRKEYRKQDYDKYLIDIDEDVIRVNEAGAWKYAQLKREYDEMMKIKQGFVEFLLRQMGMGKRRTKSLEKTIEKKSLEDFLRGLIEVKIFESDKKVVQDSILEKMIGKIERNKEKLGLASINAIFSDLDIPYVFRSYKETRGEFRNKWYWVLEEKQTTAPKSA
ncbi:MAG: DEAD/DEAH box helicase family protein [Zhenhengia sp.]